MTGIPGDEWAMDCFSPMDDIPSLGKLTVYTGESKNISSELLQKFIDNAENGSIFLNIDTIFKLDEVRQAHEYLESNRAQGKLVVEIG